MPCMRHSLGMSKNIVVEPLLSYTYVH